MEWWRDWVISFPLFVFHIFSLCCKDSADTGRKLNLAKYLTHSSFFFFIEVDGVWKWIYLAIQNESNLVLRRLRRQNLLFWRSPVPDYLISSLPIYKIPWKEPLENNFKTDKDDLGSLFYSRKKPLGIKQGKVN